MCVHTAENVSLTLAASRCVSYFWPMRQTEKESKRCICLFQVYIYSHTGERRKCQFIVTVSAIITSVADAATPQRSNAPLRDATARLSCGATCVATHARNFGRETRLERAGRAPRSLRESNSRNRCHPLDEPRLRLANPAGW